METALIAYELYMKNVGVFRNIWVSNLIHVLFLTKLISVHRSTVLYY